MSDDELDDDESSAGGPIHPDDRLWRHPSEIAKSSAPASRPASPPPADILSTTATTTRSGMSGRMWAVALVAGITGASVALAAIAMTGGISPKVVAQQSAVTPVSMTTIDPSPSPKTVRRIVIDTASVMARITVLSGGRQRQGSGLVVRSDGALLTSETLVRDADAVTVTLPGGKTVSGTVRGTDPSTGLAVVRVPASGLAVAVSDPATPRPGDQAVVVTGAASPSEEPWVTSGIVSSVNRNVTAGDQTLIGLIETSTPVPDSADGSASVAPDGEVTGVCVVIDGNDTDPGSSYAVPIAVASAVADDLIHYGRARRAWLGVVGDDLTPAEAQSLGVEGGAVISTVDSPSPARSAGLRAGDIVTAVAGHGVHTMLELVGQLPLHRPGEIVKLTVYRGSKPLTIKVTLGERR